MRLRTLRAGVRGGRYSVPSGVACLLKQGITVYSLKRTGFRLLPGNIKTQVS